MYPWLIKSLIHYRPTKETVSIFNCVYTYCSHVIDGSSRLVLICSPVEVHSQIEQVKHPILLLKRLFVYRAPILYTTTTTITTCLTYVRSVSLILLKLPKLFTHFKWGAFKAYKMVVKDPGWLRRGPFLLKLINQSVNESSIYWRFSLIIVYVLSKDFFKCHKLVQLIQNINYKAKHCLLFIKQLWTFYCAHLFFKE